MCFSRKIFLKSDDPIVVTTALVNDSAVEGDADFEKTETTISIKDSTTVQKGSVQLQEIGSSIASSITVAATPGYVNAYDKWKAKGIDHLICISVNDPFVMHAWGKSCNVGDKILMVGDPFLNFTKGIGADVDKSARGLGIRSNRYTMLVDNLKIVKLQEEADTGSCEISAAENFIKLV